MNPLPAVPTVSPVAPRRRRRAWPWIAALVALVPVLLCAAALASWLGDGGTLPLHVVIDGEDWGTFDPALWGAAHPAAVAVGLLAAFIAVAVVVPLVIGLAILAVGFGLMLGLGVPLFMALLLAAVALSPLLLLVALGVWLWRRFASRHAATIRP